MTQGQDIISFYGLWSCSCFSLSWPRQWDRRSWGDEDSFCSFVKVSDIYKLWAWVLSQTLSSPAKVSVSCGDKDFHMVPIPESPCSYTRLLISGSPVLPPSLAPTCILHRAPALHPLQDSLSSAHCVVLHSPPLVLADGRDGSSCAPL